MQIILLCVIVAVGVTVASDQRAPSSEVQSSRTKRIYLSSSQTTTIQSGFDAATHLFDKMDGLQFDGVVGSLIGSTSSFLGAIGPFVGFVLSLFQSPNTLSSQLKAVYTKLDGRFDNVDRQLVALKAQIKFLPAEIQFNQWESNIYSLLTRFELLAAAKNSAGHTSESDSFKKTFHNVYRDAGGQLAGAVINGHLTSGRLFDAFLSKNEYDRKQTQKFMLGTLNLLMRAAYLELTYRQLKHMDVAALRRTWITRFTNIKTQMQNVDKAAVSHYHTQMVTDVDNFATQYQSGGSLSNTAFSSQLYSKLTTKVKLKQ